MPGKRGGNARITMADVGEDEKAQRSGYAGVDRLCETGNLLNVCVPWDGLADLPEPRGVH